MTTPINDMRFVGNTVVVTGAGAPLGQRIAARFARAGAFVVLADEENDSNELAAINLRKEGRRALFLPYDRFDTPSIAEFVASVITIQGGIDVWVNHHAPLAPSPAEALDPTNWQKHVNGTLSSTFYAAQAVGKHMLETGQGVIVNLVTAAAIMPIEGHAARSVTEAGVLMLTQALGIEWAKRGVRVVGVLTGPLDTELKAEARSTFERRSPMHRLGTGEEVAEAVLYVASNAASYVVGETLRVDGGWTAYQLF